MSKNSWRLTKGSGRDKEFDGSDLWTNLGTVKSESDKWQIEFMAKCEWHDDKGEALFILWPTSTIPQKYDMIPIFVILFS